MQTSIWCFILCNNKNYLGIGVGINRILIYLKNVTKYICFQFYTFTVTFLSFDIKCERIQKDDY